MAFLKADETEGLKRALDHAIAYRESVPKRPVRARISAEEAYERFNDPLAEDGTAIPQVIDDLVAKGDDGIMQMCSPNFHGFVLGASHPAGVAADLIVSAWGQNTAHADLAPTVSAIEQVVCEWIIDLLGLPENSGAGIVTGATLANTAGVSAARNELLRREGWDVEANGLYGAPEIQVIVGEEAHSAVFGALRYNGLGAERVHKVKTDSDGIMLASSFKSIISDLSGPILVIAQAGHINSGGFDPFEDIIPLARAKNAWVHVDGAFGLWLQAVPELSDKTKGVADADSWSVDLHKWLNAPFDAGMIITRDRASLMRAMTARGSYLPDARDVWDPSDSVYELSRRARGVASFVILQVLGKSGVREMVSRHCRLARTIAEKLSLEPGLSVLNTVHANQVAIRCGEGSQSDGLTKATLKLIHEEGSVYPSHGTWQGGEIIRISIIAHSTQDADADKLIDKILIAWRKVRDQ